MTWTLLCISLLLLVSLANAQQKGCKYTLQQLKSNITSPGYPVSYPHDVDCTWTIRVPAGKIIVLKATEFELEQSYQCRSDSLTIYDGPDENSPIFNKPFCDQNGPLALTSSKNTMFLHFKSDTVLARKGFLLEYEAVPVCYYEIKATNGTLSSPLYPRNYYPNANCTYLIETTPGYNIRLSFKDFELEPVMTGANDCYDFVVVYDLLPTGRFQLKKTCGANSPGVIRTVSNRMLIRFVSDSSVNDRGFNASFSSEYYTCKSNEFRCGNGLCIGVDALCDRHDDCGDNSDETSCSCRDAEFTCHNGKCVEKLWTCDDEDDCGDGSDELGCSTDPPISGSVTTDSLNGTESSSVVTRYASAFTPSSKPSCQANEIRCGNGRCVASTLACNNVDDCGDNSDEISCHGSCSIKNGGCSQKCHFDRFFGVSCSCNTGYLLADDAKSCRDIDECSGQPCSYICINTIGSFKCACKAGFELDSRSQNCTDQDECAVSNGNCQQRCDNTLGSYSCMCFSGYTLNHSTGNCDDVDECKRNNGGCLETCINSPGSYKCGCSKPGYQPRKNDSVCQDVNECASGISTCSHFCHNTEGSYTCSCRAGFLRSHSDPRSCEDIDECMEGIPGCFGRCVNTIGSYYCVCDKGLRGIENDTKCEDINECQQNNGGCEQICKNTMSSYQCQCRDGYNQKKDSPMACEDVNECRGPTRLCDHICVNTPGSYRCTCVNGFSFQNNTKCSDIDECASFPPRHDCTQTCMNSPGSYKCGCHKGFILESDGKTCRDANQVTACGTANVALGQSADEGWMQANPGSWPWQVYFRVNLGVVKFQKYGCMGVLISRKFVLTTAHCIYFGRWRVPPGKLFLHLGAIRKRDQSEIVLRAKRITLHSSYTKPGDASDLALIELERPAGLSARVRPICLPNSRNEIALRYGEVAASITWGRLSQSRTSAVLRQRRVVVTRSSSCSWLLKRWTHPSSSDVCASYTSKAGQDKMCLPDSGSPLMVKSSHSASQGSTWYLAGLQIYGAGLPNTKPCSKWYKNNRFHDIIAIRTWIQNEMNR